MSLFGHVLPEEEREVLLVDVEAAFGAVPHRQDEVDFRRLQGPLALLQGQDHFLPLDELLGLAVLLERDCDHAREVVQVQVHDVPVLAQLFVELLDERREVELVLETLRAETVGLLCVLFVCKLEHHLVVGEHDVEGNLKIKQKKVRWGFRAQSGYFGP